MMIERNEGGPSRLGGHRRANLPFSSVVARWRFRHWRDSYLLLLRAAGANGRTLATPQFPPHAVRGDGVPPSRVPLSDY